MNQEEARYLADTMVKECSTFTLGILDKTGSPRLYAMQKGMGSSIEDILFITKTESEKVRLLRADGRAGAEYHEEEQSISLKGNIKIIEDGEQMRGMLTAVLCSHLEARGFERYCVLQFLTQECSVYKDGDPGSC